MTPIATPPAAPARAPSRSASGMVSTVTRWAAALVAPLLVVVLSGCGSHHRQLASETWVGAVTTVGPQLCVGRSAATGNCFTDVTATQLAELHPGQCVAVTSTPATAPDGPAHLVAVEPATVQQTSTAVRRGDCTTA